MKLKNKQIIIAFDGPDNVGKGTQISLLRKWLNHIPFVLTNLDRPHGKTDGEKMDYGFSASKNHLIAKRAIWRENIPQIADRMHYTEYSYSINRGGHDLNTIKELENEFLEMKDDFFTIIFIDEIKNIRARDDGKSNYNVNDINEVTDITNRFSKIAKHSFFDNVIININNKNIAEVQKAVQKALLEKFPNLLD